MKVGGKPGRASTKGEKVCGACITMTMHGGKAGRINCMREEGGRRNWTSARMKDR